ncbi:13178_t:CDS:2, partial [Entrophospora sp. SA101]
SLESMIKILEGKLKSAQMDVLSVQNDSLKKDSEILSLKSKIAELENIRANWNRSEPSKDLSQYFLRGKNMDPIEKID